MNQPYYRAPRPPKPPVSGADIAVSVTVLVLTALMIAAAAVLGLFSLAFLDHCPPATCSADGAVSAVFNALLVAVGIGVVGLIVTVVQLIRRKRGWPFATATLVLCAVAFVFGGVAYSAAVG
jgi:hypothetical protein